VVQRTLVAVVVCVVLSACAWTNQGESERPSAPRIVFTKYLPGGNAEVWIARFDGSGTRRLARGRSPAISPDGRWVAFQGSHRELMLVAAAGGRPRPLMRGVVRPTWSPDSKRIAVLQQFDDRRAALTIATDSGARTTVARGMIQDWSFSPRGDEIAFTRGAPFGTIDIYIADAEGGGERRVTDDGQSAYPVWGPRAIAFARIVPYRGWGAHEIWLVRPDGRERRLLTKTPRTLLGQGIVGLVPVAWSANGRALLAELANEFGGIPHAVDPQTGSVHRIGDFDYGASPNGLSRDGRWVLVSYTGVEVSDRTRIEVVPYSNGTGHVIARRAGEASWNR
jgi:Tol biopolymer transport system component